MSKKSRKRNKKILGALAAGLGAMALMKGRGKGAVSTVGQPTGVDRVAYKPPHLGETFHQKVVVPKKKWEIKDSLADENWNKLDTSEVDISDHYAPKKLRGNLVPPSMRGGARVAEGYQDRDYYPSTWGNNWDYRAKGGRAGHKSGGRVGCGKAKRGFGRALKKK